MKTGATPGATPGNWPPRLVRARRRNMVVGVVVFLVAQAVWWTEPLPLFSALEWLTPNIVWRVPTRRPIVALSFDDGPHARYTPLALDILASHKARATFFLIGQRALAHPELVDAIRAGGHEIGNHYYFNGTILGHRMATFEANLERTEHVLGLAGPAKLFRPPGGLAWPWQLRSARARGYTCVLGSAYPHDPACPPVSYIQWLVEKNMVPGAIVILHDGIRDPSRSLEALPHILSTGKQRGLEFVTVGELLRER